MQCTSRLFVARAVRRLTLLLVILTMLAGLTACADSSRPPEGGSSLAAVEQALAGTPAYSIILADARQSGTFFSSYALQYAIERGGALSLTDWFEVDKAEYDKFAPLKGMTLLSYADGVRNATAAPPGFQHVGDPSYGSWQRDSSGNSFWQFYGQYRLLSDLMGLVMGGTLSQGDWDGARRTGKLPPRPPSTSRPSPQRDDFFNRRMKQEAAKDTKFSNKVEQRLGRSTVGTRSRGASPGK
ncbi:hypothetical protein [Megalodesulfovibrio gigas]|uniref:hypothetical protein n=1 Tax=Megalodesulfovibrio gigas TaxID=879 RepID=UPI00040DB77F|nr:hypothetical protein [Megalodesulfovibrio gigas]